MYGMMCVLYTTGTWLVLASYLELPVSTTHSTIGSIVGMVVAYGGTDCVVWMENTDTFPYVQGMVAIVASWVISPVFSGIVSFFLFLAVRTHILRSPRAFERAFWVYPILVMFTIAVNGESFDIPSISDHSFFIPTVKMREQTSGLVLGWTVMVGGRSSMQKPSLVYT